MAQALEFRVISDPDGKFGLFSFSHPLEDQFNALLDQLQDPEVSAFASPEAREMLMAECSRMVAEAPGFLDAYAHAAGALFENDEVDAAQVWYQRGLEQAYAVLPEKFKGPIPWGHIANRPFLRLHHGYLLCLIEKGEYATAIAGIEQHLKWNPNDNIGVRHLLVDLYVATERDAKAIKLITKLNEAYPAFCYNLALIEFARANYAAALTHLRRGFLENPYIAEMLLGNDNPYPKPMKIHNSDHGIEGAEEYVNGPAMDRWLDDAVLQFLNWAYNCSQSLKDRARWMELHERLDGTHDFNERGTIINQQSDYLCNAINEATSARAIRVIENRYGEILPVWDLDAYS